MNRSICPLLTAILLALPTGWAAASEPEREALPKVVLLGDSIRLSYAPAVAMAFEGKTVILRSNWFDAAFLSACLFAGCSLATATSTS